jgi:muramoyltetrapeptide carboxypeptidase LdcA involved in peptidoglycan recycling
MRYPEFLKENGTIGFVAPSFGCVIEPYQSAFKNALSKWEAQGYKTSLGPNCFASSGIGISNDPKLCGQELNDWYCSEENDVIISCGGGELMCEVVPYMDFERMKEAKPKWYMGFSDNTNFTFLSAILLDTASIYGPCAASFGMEPWHAAVQDAWDLLHGRIDTVKGYGLWEKEGIKDEEHPLVPYNVTQPVIRKRFPDNDTAFSGRLVGGCLDILCMLCGTKYDQVKAFNERYANDGVIWFLEACDLNVLSIRRAIWQLSEAGWFANAKGFLIGRPLNGEALFGLDQYDAVTKILEKYHVPILMDLDIGHLPPMMPLIEGSMADVNMTGNDLSITMHLI